MLEYLLSVCGTQGLIPDNSKEKMFLNIPVEWHFNMLYLDYLLLHKPSGYLLHYLGSLWPSTHTKDSLNIIEDLFA